MQARPALPDARIEAPLPNLWKDDPNFTPSVPFLALHGSNFPLHRPFPALHGPSFPLHRPFPTGARTKPDASRPKLGDGRLKFLNDCLKNSKFGNAPKKYRHKRTPRRKISMIEIIQLAAMLVVLLMLDELRRILNREK
jgi:hypothetical protein